MSTFRTLEEKKCFFLRNKHGVCGNKGCLLIIQWGENKDRERLCGVPEEH